MKVTSGNTEKKKTQGGLWTHKNFFEKRLSFLLGLLFSFHFSFFSLCPLGWLAIGKIKEKNGEREKLFFTQSNLLGMNGMDKLNAGKIVGKYAIYKCGLGKITPKLQYNLEALELGHKDVLAYLYLTKKSQI